MKQTARKIEITYRWWRDGDIREAHVGALEEAAMERIQSQMSEGFTGGQLLDNIHMDDEDGKDGIDYEGWWELKETNNDK
jgi:hypothetical protein